MNEVQAYHMIMWNATCVPDRERDMCDHKHPPRAVHVFLGTELYNILHNIVLYRSVSDNTQTA